MSLSHQWPPVLKQKLRFRWHSLNTHTHILTATQSNPDLWLSPVFTETEKATRQLRDLMRAATVKLGTLDQTSPNQRPFVACTGDKPCRYSTAHPSAQHETAPSHTYSMGSEARKCVSHALSIDCTRSRDLYAVVTHMEEILLQKMAVAVVNDKVRKLRPNLPR